MANYHASVPVTSEDADWLAAHLRMLVSAHPAAWARADLTLPQLTALHFIRAEGSLTLTGLAQALGTRPPATCAMVDRLARVGLVRRTPDPRDQRCVRLTVTDTAAPMIGKVDSTTAKRVQAVLHCMTPAARRCLTDVFKDTARQLAG